jgi:hypothetical protein
MDMSNPAGETNYWSYWQWDGNAWTFSNAGAGDTTVLPGSIEAWHFTSWEIFPSLAPDVAPDLSALCETPVLKNYADQPNLAYSDLFSNELETPVIEEPIETEEPITATETPAETADPSEAVNPTEETIVDEPEVIERSQLPLYLIGGAFVVVLVVVILMLVKKRK